MPDKTWGNWKFFFACKFKEVRDYHLNALSSGFASNLETAYQATAEMLTEMTQYQTEALANLTTATQADRQAFTALMEMNATLKNCLE